jgi:hypothetical protein
MTPVIFTDGAGCAQAGAQASDRTAAATNTIFMPENPF